MFFASLYIIGCTARNRLRVRLRRLREPRYLFGAIAGAAYLYFTFFARLRGRRTRVARARQPSAATPVALASLAAAGPSFLGMTFLALAAAAWLLPMTAGLLDFSEAEVQFLFTAPVTRRSLLIHRLMRSQLALLFTAAISAIAFPREAGGVTVRFLVGMWVVLLTMRMYATGVALSRAKLATSEPGARRLARAPLVLVLGALVVVGVAIVRRLRSAPVTTAVDAIDRVAAAVASGVPHAIVWPFAALGRPLFAATYASFFGALAIALIVPATVVVWVLASDEAFQEAAEEDTRRRAEKRLREGRTVTLRAAGWQLARSGRAEHVFFWKNALQMLRATGGLELFRYFIPVTIIVVVLSTLFLRASDARGFAALLCVLASAIGAFTVILGPQVLRVDLRDDLRHLEVLKTWPVRAAAVLRGELMLPGFVLTGVAWLALLCATIFSAAAFPRLTIATRLSGACAAVIIVPALVFAQLTVQNAAAVLFPAWVPLGNQRPRGLDQMGQRLILLGAVMITLLIMMLPGVAIGAVLWIAFYRFIGAAVLIPGAVICLAIVALEVLAATEALGPAYEHLDIMSVERSE